VWIIDQGGIMAVETSAEFMQEAVTRMITLVQDAVSTGNWPFPSAIFLAPEELEGGFPIVPFPPNDGSEERQQFCAALGYAIASGELPEAPNPRAVFILSEVWYTEGEAEGSRPSESPNKKEALVIAGLASDGEQIVSFGTITRRTDASVESIEFDDSSMNATRMYTLEYFWEGYTQALLEKSGAKNKPQKLH